MDEPYDEIDVDAELELNDQYENNNTQPLHSIDTTIHTFNHHTKTTNKRKWPLDTPPDTLPSSINHIIEQDSMNDIAQSIESIQHKKPKPTVTTVGRPVLTYVQRSIPLTGLYTTAVVRDHIESTNLLSHRSVYMTVQSEAELYNTIHQRKQQFDHEQMCRDNDHTDIVQMLSRIDDELLQSTISASVNNESQQKLNIEYKKQAKLIGNKLWVDKYTPNTFQDLLSPESINRQVLAWLCSWDTYVFGKKRINKDPSINTSNIFNKLTHNNIQPNNKYNNKRRISVSHSYNNNTNNSTESGDPNDLRPSSRVILLCGAPGTGKTTVAHILARHAGYNPYEINASDDRSTDVLMNKIASASEMRSLLGDRKPNCIILDEIDGVLGDNNSDDKGTINALVKLITAKPRYNKSSSNTTSTVDTANDTDSENENENNDTAKSTKPAKPHKSVQIQRRPIICICNDQYASALRPLRQIATIYQFDRPLKSRLLDRLKYICKHEDILIDDRVLNALIELTDCDIRSCLNTLHFVRSSNQRITLHQLNSMDIARKDITKTQFSIWENILYKQLKQKSTKFNDYQKRQDVSHNSSVQLNQLYNELMDYGEHQRVTDGVHYNYLNMSIMDPTGDKISSCSDWLSYYNIIDTQLLHDSDYSLYPYIPLCNIAIHQIITEKHSSNKVRLQLPLQLTQYNQTHNQNIMLLQTYMNQSNNSLRLNGYSNVT